MIRRAYRAFTSARATVLLLALLALLLTLTVALPQAPIVGEEVVAQTVEGRPLLRFLLLDLGFASMATSPVFLGVLALFFLNLALVLLARLAPTWRRIQVRPRPERGLVAWTRAEGARSITRPSGWRPEDGVAVLRASGYAVPASGKSALWGVKHRTAALGFLAFHASFFLLCAGGLQLWATRFVGIARLSEGQLFQGAYGAVERVPPLGAPAPPRFRLAEVETRFVDGEPVHLGAVLAFDRGDAEVVLRSRVNHPARWGSATMLVNEAGLSPVLWLQGQRGETVDRVALPMRTRGGVPTEVPLDEGRLRVVLSPLAKPDEFPAREDLPHQPIELEILQAGTELWRGELRTGEAASFEGERLVLEELRYWAAVRVVDERGGGLLIAGFVLAIIGLLWRLPLCRREVALSWDDEELRLAGTSEYFAGRFQAELDVLAGRLAEPAPATARSDEETPR